MSNKTRPSVPKKMLPVYESVTEWSDAFCLETLSEEYAAKAREMTAALARKRPSPLLRGQPKSWACGILLALARINFLFDLELEPPLTAAEFCKLFGVSQSTAFAKAKEAETALKITLMDSRWTLPSKLEDNPLAWTVLIDGLVVDVRMLPKELQEEAFKAGLIPGLPPTDDD